MRAAQLLWVLSSVLLSQLPANTASDQCSCTAVYLQECHTTISQCLQNTDSGCLFTAMIRCLPDVSLSAQQIHQVYLIIQAISKIGTTEKPRTSETILVTIPDFTTHKPFKPITETSIVNERIEIMFDTGDRFLDFIISLLETLEERKIGRMIHSIIGKQRVEHEVFELMVRNTTFVPEVEAVETKLELLIHKYSSYSFNKQNLLLKLNELHYQNPMKYVWLAKIIEIIYVELNLEDNHSNEIPNVDYWFFTTYEIRQTTEVCHDQIEFHVGQLCEKFCSDEYGGNWVLIQSRENTYEASGEFHNDVANYKTGFGSMKTGYWMGLQCLHAITGDQPHEILFEITDEWNQTALAHYDGFSVGSEATGYQLSIGGFQGGAAGDSLAYAAGREFRYGDADAAGICFHSRTGGWWFDDCYNMMMDVVTDSSLNNRFGDITWGSLNSTGQVIATRIFIRKSASQLLIG